jgi:hypothetical protein
MISQRRLDATHARDKGFPWTFDLVPVVLERQGTLGSYQTMFNVADAP